MRLELTRHNCHYPLKVARLPIPPSGHKCGNILEAFATKMRDFRSKKIRGNIRAKNGTRTRDPNLGKVVLYQLSYFRKFYGFTYVVFPFCDAKVDVFFVTCKYYAPF